MGKVTFYLNIFKEIQDKVKKDPDYFKNKLNQVPVYIDYSFGKRLRTSTKIFVNPNDWDQGKQRIKGTDPDHGPKNHRLSVLRGKLIEVETKAISQNIKLSIEFIKGELSPGIDIPSYSDNQKFFTDTWKEFVKDNPDMNRNTRRNYDNTLAVLQDFSIKHNWKLTFDRINEDFINELRKYFATERKVTNNTAGKYIKNIKAFMNHCTRKKYNTNLAFKNFEVCKDPKEVTYLSIEEIKAIKELELQDETLQQARDLFLFCCFSGLRYSDTQKIRPVNIKEGFITFTVVKTKKPQSTPITHQANEILKKYNCHLPKMELHVYNDKLKELGKAAEINEMVTRIRFIGSERNEKTKPKHEFFSSHLAKRTFISIFFRGGGRIETIMKTTGNRDKKSFEPYLEITNKDIKEETDQIFNKLDI